MRFFRLTAPAAVPAYLGAESLKKPHDIVTLSFRQGVKGQANYVPYSCNHKPQKIEAEFFEQGMYKNSVKEDRNFFALLSLEQGNPEHGIQSGKT